MNRLSFSPEKESWPTLSRHTVASIIQDIRLFKKFSAEWILVIRIITGQMVTVDQLITYIPTPAYLSFLTQDNIIKTPIRLPTLGHGGKLHLVRAPHCVCLLGQSTRREDSVILEHDLFQQDNLLLLIVE